MVTGLHGNGQARHQYIPGARLLVATPPSPRKERRIAPLLLSHLQCLLPLRGNVREEKLPFLLALFLPLLVLHQSQNPRGIVFDSEQLHHLRPRLFLIWIQLSVFCLQRGVLLFQRLHGRKFFQAQAVKEPLRCLAGNDGTGVFGVKSFFLFWPQLAILSIDLAGFAICTDAPLRKVCRFSLPAPILCGGQGAYSFGGNVQ